MAVSGQFLMIGTHVTSPPPNPTSHIALNLRFSLKADDG